jgi:hypothetical protein
MDALLYQFGSFALVGALWGCTNPLLKEGSSDSVDEAAFAGEKNTEQRGFLARQLHILLGVLTNWRFVVPFALSQQSAVSRDRLRVRLSGWDSQAQKVSLAVAVPICSSEQLPVPPRPRVLRFDPERHNNPRPIEFAFEFHILSLEIQAA